VKRLSNERKRKAEESLGTVMFEHIMLRTVNGKTFELSAQE